MLGRAPIRLRLAAAFVVLLVGVLSVVLALSWWLLSRHLGRTVPDVYAGPVLSALAGQYALAVGGAAVAALGIGWLVAGHALAPLRRIASTAGAITDDDLDARVRLDGPDDEVRELASAFDAMLDRVAASVEAQRRFVANASHELRTPLTVMRAEAEVALDDPTATAAELREVAGTVVEAAGRMEALLDGLLVLAAADRGVRRDDAVRVDAVVRRACDLAAPDAADAGSVIRVERCDAATVAGDAVLLERVVANLLENAVRHGRLGDVVRVALVARPDRANVLLSVRNGGAVISAGDLARLTEPFERLGRARARGTGLGLSIVRSVAEAHGGSLRLAAPPGGGLEALVTLPARLPAGDAAGRSVGPHEPPPREPHHTALPRPLDGAGVRRRR